MKNQYFTLDISEKVNRPLTIIGLPSRYNNKIKKEGFDQLERAVVAYYSSKSHPEISGVLTAPAFLFNDPLKHIIELYEPRLEAKAIQIFGAEPECTDHYLYWFPYLTPVSCLHGETEKYPNGMLKKLVLAEARLPQAHVFQVAGILEHRVIISLPLAESILRRCPYGIRIQPVEVR